MNAVADSAAGTASDFFTDENPGKVTRRLVWDRFLTFLCIGLSFCTLIPLFSIVYLVVQNGLPLMKWATLTQLPPAAGLTGGGFGNAIVGTLVMVGIALIIAVPLGILSSIFINEYAPNARLSHAVRFVAKLLTGIPSIICGVFAFAVIVMWMKTFSAIAGGFALAILILPTILLTAEQALIGVPKAYREASFGLGATNFQTIWRVVLPEAFPAIMSGIMLAVARAAGETAPVLFTALFSQQWMRSLKEPTASLSVLIYNFATMPDHYLVQMAWAASLVLVVIVTIANVVAQTIFSKKQVGH